MPNYQRKGNYLRTHLQMTRIDCALNLSSPISTDELSVLSKGLTFIPKPKHMDIKTCLKTPNNLCPKSELATKPLTNRLKPSPLSIGLNPTGQW